MVFEEKEAMSDWQPIETAPKDGTPILIWYPRPRKAGRVNNVWGTTRIARWRVNYWLLDAPAVYKQDADIQYWMSLPEPPLCCGKEG